MFRWRSSSVGFLLASFSPAVLYAQVAPASPSGSRPAQGGQAPAAADDSSGPQLPPNVVLTTPDGKPLPPDLLRKVIDILKDDPAVRAAAGNETSRPVTKRIDGTEIVITGKPLRGRVLGNVAPVRTYDPIDIQAYGVSTIGDLVTALGDEVTSNHGAGEKRPIVLLNGRRTSRFEEIALYPPEAIERMEVFPEALALEYGFPPGQKVMNIVTFKFFTQKSARISLEQPTAGGRDGERGEFQILRIVDKTRYNLDLKFDRSGQLRESQRGIVEPPDALGQGPYRTLLPKSRDVTLSGSLSGILSQDASYTISASGALEKTEALVGLGPDGPLRENNDRRSASLGGVLTGEVHKWLWTSTSTYNANSSTTAIDSAGGAAASSGHSTARSLSSDLSLTGSLLKLPAGSALTTLRAQYELQNIHALQSGAQQSLSLARRGIATFANLTVPLVKRDMRLPVPIGDVSINGHVEGRRWTGRGQFLNFGYGVYWSPVEAVHFYASAESREEVPTLEQLGAAVIEVPNVRLYDFAEGRTVDVTETAGGNRNLADERRHIVSAGFNIRPFGRNGMLFSLDYTRTAIDRPIEQFPIITPQVKDAFPDRFRGGLGGLTAVDARPINLFRSRQAKLKWGVSLTRAFGSSSGGSDLIFAPATEGPPPPGLLPPNTRIIDNPPGTPLPPEIENAISRIYFSFYDTWCLNSTAVLREGGPNLDLLGGFALSILDNTPRHELAFSGGIFRHGIGARTNVRWRSGTTVYGSFMGLSSRGNSVHFAYRPVIDLELFVIPEERIVGEIPHWIKGVQVVLGITNLTGVHPVARDQDGRTPLSYQRAYLDPVGRSITLSVRKIL